MFEEIDKQTLNCAKVTGETHGTFNGKRIVWYGQMDMVDNKPIGVGYFQSVTDNLSGIMAADKDLNDQASGFYQIAADCIWCENPSTWIVSEFLYDKAGR